MDIKHVSEREPRFKHLDEVKSTEKKESKIKWRNLVPYSYYFLLYQTHIYGVENPPFSLCHLPNYKLAQDGDEIFFCIKTTQRNAGDLRIQDLQQPLLTIEIFTGRIMKKYCD